MAMKTNERASKPETLCFRCGNSCGGCSWSKDFVPVEGWKAEPTLMYVDYTPSGQPKVLHEVESFFVTECPKFVSDEEKPLKEINEDGFKPFLFAILNRLVRDYAAACIKYNRDPHSEKALHYEIEMRQIELYCTKPMFEDIANALEIPVDGLKLLQIVRDDPQGVLERINTDPQNYRGKQAEEYRARKERKRRKELNYAD